MDLKSLRLYLAVLEHGSITKASQYVNVTQPALGLHIRKLEQAVGVQLLERHSRGITVTEAGRTLAVHARNILKDLERAQVEMTRYAEVPTGHIAIGLTPTVREAIATPLVEKVTEKLGGVHLVIKEALSETLIEYLLSSRIDIALLYNTRAGGEQLNFEPMAVENMYFVYPLGEGGHRGQTITATDALRHKLILPTRPHLVRTEIDRLAEKLEIETEIIHEVDSSPAIRHLVASGLGWSVMPRPPAWDRSVGAQRVVEPEIKRLLHIAYAKGRPISRAFEALIEIVAGVVEDERRRPDGHWRSLEAPQLQP